MLKARHCCWVFTLFTEMDGHWFHSLQKYPAEHVGHHHVSQGTWYVRVAGPWGLRDHLLPASGDKKSTAPPLSSLGNVSRSLKGSGASLGVHIYSPQGTELRKSWTYSHPGHTAAFLLMETSVTELNGWLVYTQLWAENMQHVASIDIWGWRH